MIGRTKLRQVVAVTLSCSSRNFEEDCPIWGALSQVGTCWAQITLSQVGVSFMLGSDVSIAIMGVMVEPG